MAETALSRRCGAVTLAGFNAEGTADAVVLRWETVWEQGNAGFNIYRSANANEAGTLLTEALIPSASGSEGASYEWIDVNIEVGTTYFYWLEAVAVDGSTQRFGPLGATVEAPTNVALGRLDAAGVSSGWWLGALGMVMLAVAMGLRRRAA